MTESLFSSVNSLLVMVPKNKKIITTQWCKDMPIKHMVSKDSDLKYKRTRVTILYVDVFVYER